ncbi:putative MYND-type zinc finger protein samB [Gigaspora margarita]|uniref:Putative MYND-type zinc finger protein samB n=1 Tax=Gigaspora margarita TaxID=4874 RepID=A0A8H3X9V2_GIGMA|nr:putative MYND-type zinc finger protein samB [Gigaspora margarita]
MRESNFSFPSQNRASVCITSALYDRRALDCTAILPLINSLTHLTYLTSTSPRIREILTMDGGLERLVRILKTTKVNDKRSGWKWSMAFQCVANVGVRGSEAIRTRVVDAGMVPVIITVLDNFLRALDHVRLEKEQQQQQLLAAQLLPSQNPPLITRSPSPQIPLTTAFVGALENAAASTNRFLSNVSTTYDIRSSDDARSDVASWGSVADNEEAVLTTTVPQLPSAITGTTGTNITPSIRTTQTPNNTPPTNSTTQSTLEIDVLYREEDILLSLQLLAYLSKYPHLRATFHNAYPPHNVFSLVEKFTHRLHPGEIQYWAGVIMRNACRKDEDRGGIRQCAYMACGKWESFPREFAKCRRCRKAKYCSKACQSKAWSEGHRWWCMERHSHS